MIRPLSIVTFERCYIGAWVVGIVNLVLNWNTQIAMADTPSAEAAMGRGGIANMIVMGLVVSALVTAALWYFVARRGSVVAKWIVVVFFGIGVLMLLSRLAQGSLGGGLGAILTLVGIVLQAIAVAMLFRPDAVAWFAGRRGGDVY